MPKDLFNFLPLAIALLIVLRRSRRASKVRVERAWVIPGLALLGVWSTLAREPVPSGVALAILVAAAAVGIGAGYYRALHIELSLDPESGQVMSKATPFGTILVVVFLVIRVGLDFAINGSWRPGPPAFVMPPARHGVDLFRLADAALIFSTAMTIGQRFEIWRRAHALLKAEKPKGIPAA
jgi:hypothetical protein